MKRNGIFGNYLSMLLMELLIFRKCLLVLHGMTFIAFIMMLIIIIRRVCFGDPVAGWASTMCAIIFIGAIQLFSIGIMGQYIAKTYNEAKHRPHYIISESNKETVKKVN